MNAYMVRIVLLILAISMNCTIARAETPDLLVCDIWPPYQMKTHDSVEGFSVDVVRAVHGRLGSATPRIISFPWKRAVDMVKHQRALGVFSINRTPEREVYMRFPDEPLALSPWILWTRSGDRLQSLEDLKGKKVGVVLGYSYTPEFWEFIETYCDVEEVRTDQVNFHKLKAGRVDAVAAEFGNGYHLKNMIGADHVVANMNVLIKRDGLYLAFGKDSVSQQFVETFSRELKAYKQTEEYRRLRVKFFGQ